MSDESKEPCATSQFSITTPLGSMVSKGKRNAELIAALALAVMALQLYLVYTHVQDTKIMGAELSGALKQVARAQREMACVISMPQEKREAEYLAQNSFCKQMGAMQ